MQCERFSVRGGAVKRRAEQRQGEVRGDPFYSAASASTSTPCISPGWEGPRGGRGGDCTAAAPIKGAEKYCRLWLVLSQIKYFHGYFHSREIWADWSQWDPAGPVGTWRDPGSWILPDFLMWSITTGILGTFFGNMFEKNIWCYTTMNI